METTRLKLNHLYLVALFCVTRAQLDLETNSEELLIKRLLSNTKYSAIVRPTECVTVYFTVYLKQLVSLEDKTQTLTSSSNIYATWTDPRLTWVPSENVSRLYIPANQIWLPDMVVKNTIDGEVFLRVSSSNLAIVEPNGTVYVTYSASALKTSCIMNVLKYPFDIQICNLTIGSWSLSSQDVNYTSDVTELLDRRFFYPSEIWALTNVSFELKRVATKFTHIENYDMDTVYLYLTLKREPMSFLINSIFPCLVLNMLTLLLFGLPQASQITISMTVFTTFSVYSTRIVSEIPAQGDYLPRISLYFLFSLVYSAATFGWFALENVIRNEQYLPSWLERVLEKARQLFKAVGKSIGQKKKVNTVQAQANTETSGKENQAGSKELGLVNQSCQKCESCDQCRTKQAEDDDLKQTKNAFEANMSTLSQIVFSIMLVAELLTNLGIWLYLSF